MLNSGDKLGHYTVTAKLGEGGMGIVYRGTDTRLNRGVALKVLPAAFARDAERMARFAREAQVLAALNHPNIAAIYGLEESDGVRALVMELVEGATLREKVKGGALAVDEALPIARQMAEGLEAAHEKGIIHRDLKPANVKVTPEGTVKVLDFGLAKALEGDASGLIDPATSPTLTVEATKAGIILGTAAYMSPEQARGKAVDRRADIWAFGCVLYEMLTGKQTFSGETVSDTLAAVIRAEPDWSVLPAALPHAVQRLLKRCFEKDPRKRLQAIGEARIAIEEALADPYASWVVMSDAGTRPAQWRRALPWAAAGLLAVAAGILGWSLKPEAGELPNRKLEIPVEKLEGGDSTSQAAVLSPGGTKIAFRAAKRLWVRALNELVAREVSGGADTHPLFGPFWSPDSAYVGFAAEGRLWKAAVGGGERVLICTLPTAPAGGAGASWGPNGRIVFSLGSEAGLYEVSAGGGDPKPWLAIEKDMEGDLHDPYLLPEGKGVLFVAHGKSAADTISVFDGKKRKALLKVPGQFIWNPVYSPTGHILFQREPDNAGVWAVPFSLAGLETTGEAFVVAPGAMNQTLAADGTLAYVRVPVAAQNQIVITDRSGRVLQKVGEPHAHTPFLTFAPDGKRLVIEDEEQEQDLWVYDVVRNTRTRLTFTPTVEFLPAWSPTGRQIAYTETSEGPPSGWRVMLKSADGSGEAQEVARAAMQPSFSRDGKYLFFCNWAPDQLGDISYIKLGEEAKPQLFFGTRAREGWPQLSPDGRLLAYMSNESGRDEIYLKRFPSAEGKWQVSVEGGNWPHWNRRGDRVYYVRGDDMMEVEVSGAPQVVLGTPRKLFTRPPLRANLPFGFAPGFEMTPDGERFALLQETEQHHNQLSITVVQNWFAEFRDKQK